MKRKEWTGWAIVRRRFPKLIDTINVSYGVRIVSIFPTREEARGYNGNHYSKGCHKIIKVKIQEV